MKTFNIQHSTFNGQSHWLSRVVGCSVLNVECWMFLFVLCFAATAQAQTLSDNQLANIRFDQKLNSQISLALPFRDENGNAVQLKNYFGTKPVILVLGYYQCPMLCTLTLNGMIESLQDLKWSIGKDFDVINVSIDPSETPALALAKKQNYLKRYGRSGASAGWHFLTGDEAAIRQLAGEVGFQFVYDPVSKQFAHPGGLIVLTPEGKVSRYVFGVTYGSKDVFTALQGASFHKVGSPIQQLVLLCFHYNPITGKYGAAIMLTVRVLGVATLLGLGWLITAMARRPQRVTSGSGVEKICNPSETK
jgi:protein SCO1/2